MSPQIDTTALPIANCPIKEVGMVCRPAIEETDSGDICFLGNHRHGALVALVDVEGHGQKAHDMALQYREFISSQLDQNILSTENILTNLHAHMHRSKGAVAGICRINNSDNTIEYAGIGNITSTLYRAASRQTFVSRNGLLGTRIPLMPKSQSTTFKDKDLLLMHSDGVSSHFNLFNHPDVLQQDPQAIAEFVVERFGYDHDDASCLVIRLESAS